jgi:hypothetical protein
MAVSGTFFEGLQRPALPHSDPRPCERKPRIGPALRRNGLTEPPFGTKNCQSPFMPRTVVKTGAWAIARQAPVRHAGMRRRRENQRAPPPLTDYTPVFWLRRGTSPPIRPKSLADLEKKIPRICRKVHDLRAVGFRMVVEVAAGGAFSRDGIVASTDGHAHKVATSVVVARAGLTALESTFRNASENLSPSVPLLAGFEPIRCYRDCRHARTESEVGSRGSPNALTADRGFAETGSPALPQTI